jgi:hypothetical protein
MFEGSLEVRRYGQMKSRDGKSQRREEEKKVSEERRSRCAKR